MKKILFLCLFNSSLLVYSQSPNTIPTSGDVGIGTNNPNTKLQVCGKAVFDSSLVVKDTLRVLKDLIIDNNVLINGELKINSLAGLSAVIAVIDASGRLQRGGGPGTFEAFYQLECPTDVNGNPIPLGPFWQAVPSIMFIKESECVQDVKVGIGTNSPLARLEVIDQINMLRPLMKLSNFATPDNCFIVNHDGTTGIGLSFPQARLHIRSVGSEDLIRLNNLTGTQFAVKNNGHVYAREVKVTLNTIPDYVFEKGYKLMSLAELKDYIEKFHHLPNVPSQKEVIEDNGINIGKFAATLLEKIEENVLYTLQLSQENQELKKQLDNTKKEISEVKSELTELKKQLNEISSKLK